MYDLPQTPTVPPNQVTAIIASEYAHPLSLRKRRPAQRPAAYATAPGPRPKRKKTNRDYREILATLKKTCEKLKLHEHGLHISLLELPEGFELKAYDCNSNRQVCRQLTERFFASPEKIELLLNEIMRGTGLVIDLSV